MRLSIYSHAMERLAIIGDSYVSCAWSEGYNTCEAFVLELQATEQLQQLVRPDCYVGRADRAALMVVKTVQIRDGLLTASGHQATRVLDDVAFRGTIPAGSRITTALRNAWNSSQRFQGVSWAPTNLPDTYDHTISNKSMQELAEKMCQAADIGIRAVRVSGSVEIQLYKPAYDPNKVISPAFGSAALDGITLSTERLKNHALVLGQGEGDDRETVEVDTRIGSEQLRSMIVDARDLSQGKDETIDEYRARLAARGYEKLLEQLPTWEAVVLPYPGDFGTRYDLGDIITLPLPSYGLRLQARLARTTWNSQDNRTELTIEVGSITIVR